MMLAVDAERTAPRWKTAAALKSEPPLRSVKPTTVVTLVLDRGSAGGGR